MTRSGYLATLPAILWLAFVIQGCAEEEGPTAASPAASSEAAPDEGEELGPLPPAPDNPRVDPTIDTLPGFVVEQLYEPDPETQGSWVALCVGPGGVLYTADQYGSLYEVTPPPLDDYEATTGVRALPVEVGGAQGLCWAFDSLYVMATGSGLTRVTDSDGDGELDTSELLVEMTERSEHGPHAIVPAPDGESLLFVAGNHTALPELASSRVPTNWGEDLLLPREPDARGHAAGVMAPGGVICKVNPDGSGVELLSAGYRNCYDLAVHPNGEIFTYDADMEWDLGMPWYRPTRICHAVSGADFGWRHGTGKWPEWREDSLPGAVDLGPGSPTGLVFGTGAAFPAKYQRALYALDWTYGVMYAVHLEEDGASYGGRAERFVSGKPLPLTDAVVSEDGALYFTTGGRRVRSRLYRVTYEGRGDTAAALPDMAPTQLAELRRELESLHAGEGVGSPGELERAWQALGHQDRFVRYAARVAVEHQPVEWIRERALGEGDPSRAVLGLLALARQGEASDQAPVVRGLLGIEHGSLDEQRQLARLRALQLAFIRLGGPDESQREAVIESLDPLLPSGEYALDAELARILIAVESPSVVEKCLRIITESSARPPIAWAELARGNDAYGAAIEAMLDDPPPTEQLQFAHMLRTARARWTLERRKEYLTFLNRARVAGGGMSYVGFIDRMRERFLEGCAPAELAALESWITPPELDNLPEMVAPRGPGRLWTVSEASRVVANLRGRDYDRGAGLYRAAMCAQCHQFAGFGANAGPDLTSARTTYSKEDLLRAIIEPSYAVTDQYAVTRIELTDGGTITGLVVEADEDSLRVARDFMDPGRVVVIPRDEVVSSEVSSESPMPAGLINPLNEEELRDLVAFLLSGGNREHPMFR